jgi:hypothetical protein
MMTVFLDTAYLQALVDTRDNLHLLAVQITVYNTIKTFKSSLKHLNYLAKP